ncbi:MAG: hypothetical protein NC187_01275 [Candidatus Amulumruptor caecigallinarius]|nr:hypothetical protein [Candidatus Amulumruptor caecigallinarius]MCM1396107.1 hypothetical protein [Candidatus Amulumruptor caecigallinarius]MCM1453884.1 hypothetical protein [bacterium]
MTVKSLMAGLVALTSATVATAAIPATYSVTPAPGSTVTEIKEIVVTSSVDTDFWPYSNAKIYVDDASVAFTAKVSGSLSNVITYTLTDAITAAGEHTIRIPSGSFDYGESGWEEPNEEISFSVTIGGGSEPNPEPTPEPEEDPKVIPTTFQVIPEAGSSVFSITEITVKSTEYDYLVANSSKKLSINGSDVDATTSTSGSYKNLLTYTLAEPVTTPGKYLIVLPKGAFTYEDDWGDTDSDEFRFVLTVSDSASLTGINAEAHDGAVKAYDLNGRMLPGISTEADLNRLPAGIYIINGRKQAVK